MIEPRVLDERRDRRAQPRRCASPTSAAPTCAPSSPPAGSGAPRLLELHERVGADDAARGVRRGARLRRAAHARLHRASWTTASVHARATCSRRARATSRSCCSATVDGDRADARLHRHRRPARRQPQLPARRHPLGLLLRDPRADRSRHPAQRRRLPPDRGDRARGLPAQRALAGGGRRRQRRDLLARRRRRAAARSAARSGRGR